MTPHYRTILSELAQIMEESANFKDKLGAAIVQAMLDTNHEGNLDELHRLISAYRAGTIQRSGAEEPPYEDG